MVVIQRIAKQLTKHDGGNKRKRAHLADQLFAGDFDDGEQ